ncbi:hypothetical protein Y1Q_0015631 [Alligator mississippiensis]|uniref:Uncharacterized protein n=1 Tax=Alligator mississippiensis TaxID=8496 RepID=A0A151NP06_ALLMI|nr:hypothetical protein Y1Q_0015631 [Alligator mississippiensis]
MAEFILSLLNTRVLRAFSPLVRKLSTTSRRRERDIYKRFYQIRRTERRSPLTLESMPGHHCVLQKVIQRQQQSSPSHNKISASAYPPLLAQKISHIHMDESMETVLLFHMG